MNRKPVGIAILVKNCKVKSQMLTPEEVAFLDEMEVLVGRDEWPTVKDRDRMYEILDRTRA